MRCNRYVVPLVVLRGLACAAVLAAALVSVARAQTEIEVFAEDFDGVAAPGLPTGWGSLEGAWSTSASVSSPGSGLNNLTNTGSVAGYATTPVLDLSGLPACHLRYLARRTSTYDVAGLAVTASTDGGVSFPIVVIAAGAALPAGDGAYEEVSAALPPEVVGAAQVVFRFEAAGTSSGNIRIDDVAVVGTASFDASPRVLAFAADAGATQVQTVTVTNAGEAAVALEAPVVLGDAFSIVPAGPQTVDAGSSLDFSITFAPLADGAFTGTATFSDGAGTAIEVALTGSTSGTRLDFSAEASAALESSGFVPVPLRLTHVGEAGLQGLQFTITWDDPRVSLSSISPGPPIFDAAQWTIATDYGPTSASVVVLGNQTAGVAPGLHDPLLTLVFASASIAPDEEADVTFTLGDVVGALALPTGDDANVGVETAAHVLALSARQAFFEPSAATLDLGAAAVGEAVQQTISVSNPGATKDLTVSAVETSNGVFAVSPASATVAPDASADFVVTFTPTATAFGAQAATITFTHDGEGGASTVEAAATGLGGRGDPGADGVVDAADVVLGVDVVLGQLVPDAPALLALDLHPFPEGDGTVDVRDLTVLVQAVVRGLWPDDVALPEESAPPAASGKQSGARVVAHLTPVGESVALEIESDVPLRAVQLVLTVPGPRRRPAERLGGLGAEELGASILVQENAETGVVRLLGYRPDGGLLPPGRLLLAYLPVNRPAGVVLRYAVAVDAELHRLPVDLAVSVGVDGEALPPAQARLGAPYPNPFRPGSGVRIPVEVAGDGPAEVEVFDVLGRRVARLPVAAAAGKAELSWDGRDARGRAAAPGLYLLRLRAGGRDDTRTVLLLR